MPRLRGLSGSGHHPVAVDDARDDERGPHDRSASLAPYARDAQDAQGAQEAQEGAPRGRRLGLSLRRGASRVPKARDGQEADRGRTAAGAGDGREGRGRTRAFFGFVADRVIETAPRVPVRDLETLRKQFPGLGPEEIADKLVSGAVVSSATVGAGVGAAAMLPVPPAMPAELAAEIVGVATVELKLIAELHEVYGHRPPGTLAQRSTAYLGAWTSERGINVLKPASLNAALGGQMRRELRQQIMKRTLRNLPNLTPFMIGAAVGAFMNRRDTARLAARVRSDLRKRALPDGDGGPGEGPRALF
ncbi:hypothetical protein [Streptomyces sp. NPDC048172]|uniref:hypothetical protein n=1 Tax=Streptomyces sp. NPDC048172 TaxID=3365505 RepID=UPI003715EABC